MIGELLGYVCDGEIYCPDCRPDDGEIGEIIDQAGDDLHGGETCGNCRKCYAPMNTHGWYEWQEFDAENAAMFRWATCRHCNAQYPYLRDDVNARRDALLSPGLHCANCAKSEVHF